MPGCPAVGWCARSCLAPRTPWAVLTSSSGAGPAPPPGQPQPPFFLAGCSFQSWLSKAQKVTRVPSCGAAAATVEDPALTLCHCLEPAGSHQGHARCPVSGLERTRGPHVHHAASPPAAPVLPRPPLPSPTLGPSVAFPGATAPHGVGAVSPWPFQTSQLRVGPAAGGACPSMLSNSPASGGSAVGLPAAAAGCHRTGFLRHAGLDLTVLRRASAPCLALRLHELHRVHSLPGLRGPWPCWGRTTRLPCFCPLLAQRRGHWLPPRAGHVWPGLCALLPGLGALDLSAAREIKRPQRPASCPPPALPGPAWASQLLRGTGLCGHAAA